jgi:hypothetical protein
MFRGKSGGPMVGNRRIGKRDKTVYKNYKEKNRNY